MIFGSIFKGVIGLAGALGGGGQKVDNTGAMVSHQNAKLNAATQRADNSMSAVHDAERNQLNVMGQKANMQQAALGRLVEGFRHSLLNRKRL